MKDEELEAMTDLDLMVLNEKIEKILKERTPF